jgi:hypothetical protein
MGENPYGLIAIMTVGLAAWDLGRFWIRVREAGKVEGELRGRHVRRLGVVCGAGLVMGMGTLAVEVQLSLAVVILLGVVLVGGMGKLLSTDRHR